MQLHLLTSMSIPRDLKARDERIYNYHNGATSCTSLTAVHSSFGSFVSIRAVPVCMDDQQATSTSQEVHCTTN